MKVSKMFVLVKIAAALLAASLDGSTELIPRKLLFGNPTKTSPRLSPDGTKLAFLAPDENQVLNVWVADAKQPGESVKITSDLKRGVFSYLWQFDQKGILYLQDKDGDENYHLYQTQIATQQTKDLTPYDKVRVQLVAYKKRKPQEMLIEMNLRTPALFDVYRLNLQTGELRLEETNPGNIYKWVSDRDLQIRATQSYTEDGGTQLRIRDSVEAPWQDLLWIGPDETCGDILGFTPDQKSLLLFSSLGGNTTRLLELEIATGGYKTIAEDPLYDLSHIKVNPKTYALEAVGVEREHLEWVAIDQELESEFRFLSDALKTPFDIVSNDQENDHWIISALSDQRTTDLYIYHRQTKELEFLFNTQPSLGKYALSAMTPISFQARDGMQLYGYLTLPTILVSRSLPLVLYVHGGPWTRDKWGFNPTIQWLANRGYAVLQINYRGSAGYGKNYLHAGDREWGGKMQTDLLDGKQWAISQGIANPKKVAIFGGSYGGYATLAGLAFTPDEFCCGIDVVGPSNLITLLQAFPPYWSVGKIWYSNCVGSLDDPDFLRKCSPLFKAHQIKKPLLIAQGANDPRVKQAESDQIVQAMRSKGLPVQYLLFADEGHGFKRPANRLKFHAAAEKFLAKYLGGRVEKPSKQENWESLMK